MGIARRTAKGSTFGSKLDAVYKEDGCSRHRLLTAGELQQLAGSNLVEVGCHTETHPLMANLSEADQQAEVMGNKTLLEGLLERPISAFSYPYGSYNAQAIVCLRRAGFTLACCSRNGTVRRDGSPFEIPRVHVQNWNGDEFSRVVSPTSIFA